MACRRSDRAQFVGCHVGAVAIRGCSRGCCPYGDTAEDIIQNERYTYTYCDLQRGPMRPCHNPYRPKFVCVECRRTFKPSLIPGNEYVIADPCESVQVGSTWAKWAARREVEAREAWRRHIAIAGRPRYGSLRTELVALFDRYSADTGGLSADELALLKRYEPRAQWTSLDALRCPGCGFAGRAVGGQFRAPKRGDDKGWVRVSHALEKGEEFSYCMTVPGERELIEESRRLRARTEGEGAWQEEKRRRIHALDLPSLRKQL